MRDVWDVLHFTGHGTDDGSLLLEDGLGVAHALEAGGRCELQAGPREALSEVDSA
jgi:hypothetical protein